MQITKLSLILTTYNSEKNLPSTLDSIENQTYENIEVIIKDGISTDRTLEIIKDYAEKSKFDVKWTSCIDTGIYDAMNLGYVMSTGDVIACFNDRFMYPEAVEEMITLIESTPECVGAHADLVYAEGEQVVRQWKMGVQKSIRLGWMPGHPTLFLKREVYEKYGLYKTDYKVSADYEFMIRFLKDKENKLVYLPKNIISMYYGGTSTSNLSSYMVSLKEGHRALVENRVRFAFVTDLYRTIRVLLQFVRK